MISILIILVILVWAWMFYEASNAPTINEEDKDV
jgi:hypothetical protein